jgi:hypothetical protein
LVSIEKLSSKVLNLKKIFSQETLRERAAITRAFNFALGQISPILIRKISPWAVR